MALTAEVALERVGEGSRRGGLGSGGWVGGNGGGEGVGGGEAKAAAVETYLHVAMAGKSPSHSNESLWRGTEADSGGCWARVFSGVGVGGGAVSGASSILARRHADCSFLNAGRGKNNLSRWRPQPSAKAS